MKYVALLSGGKDSCYALIELYRQGHELISLANLHPDDGSRDEIDSFMYQSIGSDVVPLLAECLGKPLYRRGIRGTSVCQHLQYRQDAEDEVEDLYLLLKDILEKHPDVEGVSSGAIHSTYQRTRVENVCHRLKLISLAPLWLRNPSSLLSDMISSRMSSILVKVSSMGLEPERHLGKSISQMQGHFLSLHSRYGFHVCGEGGEYETITLDCPLFKRRLVIDESSIVQCSDDSLAPIGYLKILRCHLEEKIRTEVELDAQALHSIQCQDELSKRLVNECLQRYRMQCREVMANSESTSPSFTVTSLCHTYYSSGLVFLSNITSSAEAGSEELASVSQFAECMSKVKKSLAQYKLNLSDVVFVQLYLKKMAHFSKVNASYQFAFGEGNDAPPSRCCVEMKLPPPHWVQLDCVAYSRGFIHNDEHASDISTLLVRSMSSWAPVCIGPYSQLKALGHSSFLMLSGQIGLLPSSMVLANGGLEDQLGWCFFNVNRILQPYDSSVSRGTLCATLYLKKSDRVKDSGQLRDILSLAKYLARSDCGLHETAASPVSADGNHGIGSNELTQADNFPVLIVGVENLPRDSLCELKLICTSHSSLEVLKMERIRFRCERNHFAPVSLLPLSWIRMPETWEAAHTETLSNRWNTSSTHPSFSIEVEGTSMDKITCQAFIHIKLCFDDGTQSSKKEIVLRQQNVVQVFTAVMEHINDMLEQSGLTSNQLANLQVYYLDTIDRAIIENALRISVGNGKSSEPAVATLPVSFLFDDAIIAVQIFAIDLLKLTTELWVHGNT